MVGVCVEKVGFGIWDLQYRLGLRGRCRRIEVLGAKVVVNVKF